LVKQLLRVLVLVFVALGMAHPCPGEEASLGAVVREEPDRIGEYLVQLQDGHTLQRGDVVALRRNGQESALGEAFVVRVQSNRAVVSLKGDFPVRAGDTVAFVRRPAALAARPPVPAARASESASKGTVRDPSGRLSLRLPAGWREEPRAERPDALALVGPSGQVIMMVFFDTKISPGALKQPEVRSMYLSSLSKDLQTKDIRVGPARDVSMLKRQGLRVELTSSEDLPGFSVILPGADDVLVAVGLADDAEGLRSAEALVRTARLP